MIRCTTPCELYQSWFEHNITGEQLVRKPQVPAFESWSCEANSGPHCAIYCDEEQDLSIAFRSTLLRYIASVGPKCSSDCSIGFVAEQLTAVNIHTLFKLLLSLRSGTPVMLRDNYENVQLGIWVLARTLCSNMKFRSCTPLFLLLVILSRVLLGARAFLEDDVLWVCTLYFSCGHTGNDMGSCR